MDRVKVHTKRWFRRINAFLLVAFAMLYIAAKIHFFTRYAVLGPGEYLEEHWPFWAGFALLGGVGAVVEWICERRERRAPK
jgi:hypothetical protein